MLQKLSISDKCYSFEKRKDWSNDVKNAVKFFKIVIIFQNNTVFTVFLAH